MHLASPESAVRSELVIYQVDQNPCKIRRLPWVVRLEITRKIHCGSQYSLYE